jgi:hypothetical protein
MPTVAGVDLAERASRRMDVSSPTRAIRERRGEAAPKVFSVGLPLGPMWAIVIQDLLGSGR